MKYAIVNDYIVEEIVELYIEEEILEKAKKCQNMIDITHMEPAPAVGYLFDGLNLVYTGE